MVKIFWICLVPLESAPDKSIYHYFLMFSGGIEKQHQAVIGLNKKQNLRFIFNFSKNGWKDSFFKGNLGDSFGQRKNLVKKNEFKIQFSIFIGNQKSDLKFVFWFDNENENRKKNQNSISF